jgi:sporulation protein YlmC with PRC-barrel domain
MKSKYSLIIIFLITFTVIPCVQATWWDNNWRYRQEVNITNIGISTLTNFPIYLNVTYDGNMSSNFFDLRFINGSCSGEQNLQLAHESENYTSSKADVWIKIPSLTTGTNSICMYYNNSAASSGENSTGVWDENFRGVYHLSETGTSTNRSDSTQYGNNMNAITGFDGDEDVVGIVGGATDFDGIDDIMLGPSSSSLTGDYLQKATFSAWVKHSTSPTDYIAALKRSAAHSTLFSLDGDSAGNLGFLTRTYGDISHTWLTGGSGLNDNNWHRVTAVIGELNRSLYIDGQFIASDNLGIQNVSGNTAEFAIGGFNVANLLFNGSIDEVRFSRINRSADWINQTYQLVVNQNSYVNFGSGEPFPNTAPTVTLNSPGNNSYQNKVYSAVLNATVQDINLDNLTVWFYGNGVLINTTYNRTNGTSITYNWTNPSLGTNNWTAIANDGTVNSTNEYFYINVINLTLNCEAGGGYQQGALVLVQGNATDGTNALSSQIINTSIFDSNNVLNTSINLTTTQNGTFQTQFSGLDVGSYTLNTSTTYQGFNKSCTDAFVVGSPAQFILDKITTLHNITNTTINYNITLRTINNGGSDATSTTLTDSDSSNSPYTLNTIQANSTNVTSYLKSYTRNSTTYNTTLANARVNGTDSYSGNEISANSTEIILTIPSSPVGQQLTLIKNAYYNSENSTSVNYTLSIEVVNSGGVDLTSITLIDTDLDINTLINLNRTQSYTQSNSTIVQKAASNTEKTFVKASATINSITYQSNQINVAIPGYGGPADTIVYAPASVSTSTSFDTIITVENQNEDIGQDFTVDYWITSVDELTNYTAGQQTIYVGASNSTNLTATLTSPSSAGTYRYKAHTSWVGGTATAFDSFTVTASSSGSGTSSGGGTSSVNNQDEDATSGDNEEVELDENKSNRAEGLDIFGKETIEYSSNFLQEYKEYVYISSVSLLYILFLTTVILGLKARKKEKHKEKKKKVIIKIDKFKSLKKKHSPNSAKGARKKLVFTEDGIKIGKVKEVILEDNKVHGWTIRVNKRIAKKIKHKILMVKHSDVRSIKEVMVLKERVSKGLDKIKN